jgi:hypothetical protein
MKNGLTDSDIQKAEAIGVRFYNSAEDKELSYLEEALNRTDEERFVFLMNLMKMQNVMKQMTFIDGK